MSPKRTLFLSVQNSHTIAIKGSVPMPLRTGYDTVIAHRVGKQFAYVAKEDGVVTELTPNHIGIKYENGKIDRVEIGIQYGVSTGKIIKNPMVTDYAKGQQVKKGDVVVFNPHHFSRDFFNPSQVLYKNSTLSRVTFMESNDTEEDSSTMSLKLAKYFETPVTKVRTLTINFGDSVHNLVKVGSRVESDSILCTLEDAAFSDTSMFKDDEALDTLKVLAANSPRAKYSGTIMKIECLYYGDIINASDSVKSIIDQFDNERRKLAQQMKDGRPETGQLMESVRVDGNPIQKDQLVLKIYIEDVDGMTRGD